MIIYNVSFFRYIKTVKIYHFGSKQDDSGSHWPDLFHLPSPREVGLVSGNQSLAYSSMAHYSKLTLTIMCFCWLYKRKRKRSDSVLSQSPQNYTQATWQHKTPHSNIDNITIADRLLKGWSVGVTKETKLAWLTAFRDPNLTTNRKGYVIKRTCMLTNICK